MSVPEIRPINLELQKIAKEQLFEDPDKIQEYLVAFREWIRKSPHLRARIDDQFLVTFLRGCKYSMEKAKQKLDLYFTLRTHLPELMHDRDPMDQKLRAIFKTGTMLPLPITESQGSPRLMLMRPGAYDANDFSIQELVKYIMMVNDILMLEDDQATIAGQIGVIDLANVTLAHFIQMQPSMMKKMTMISQDAMPTRQKGVHYINTPKWFEQIFSVFKTFLNEKMKSRIYVHSTFDSLYKVIPRKLMPTEYEGEAGSLQSITDEWENKIISYRDFFLEDSKYGVDEKKRPGRPKNPDSLFGIDGTFRQLQVD